MKKPVVVALSGKRFTGKDTFAEALVKEASALGIPLVQAAFATECKEAFIAEQARMGTVLDREKLLHDRTYKETHRAALTAFTEASLAKNPLVFIEQVLARIGAGPGLITDLRLRVELATLRERTTLLAVRLERSASHRTESGFVYHPATDEHRTETELDSEAQWSMKLENNGSIDEWKSRAKPVALELQRLLSSTRSAT